MVQIPYPYKYVQSQRYIFISTGKKQIAKAVEFGPIGSGKIMANLCFGDLRPDNTIDDNVNSNNGDIKMVMTTVVAILRNFTKHHPQTLIYVKGSNEERTRLYGRILRTYYSSFSKEFIIIGLMGDPDDNQSIVFNPTASVEYLAFLIKRIS